MRRPKITESTGNVFEDLGLPEARSVLLRAELMRRLVHYLNAQRLTQTAIGARLGIAQSRVSELLKGRLHKFSLAMLADLAMKADAPFALSIASAEARPASQPVAAIVPSRMFVQLEGGGVDTATELPGEVVIHASTEGTSTTSEMISYGAMELVLPWGGWVFPPTGTHEDSLRILELETAAQ